MDKIISLEFTYRSKSYYALIRTKEHKGEKFHSVTIMNGDLERKLYGYHTIIEKDGVFQSDEEIIDKEIAELKQSITGAFYRLQQSTTV